MSVIRSSIEEISFRVRDGLKLHARCYRAAQPQGRPVLCLAGLTRNGRDFHELATYLCSGTERTRDVYTIDYRGRGLSEWDQDWKNYSVPTEALDTLDFMFSAGLNNTAIIGTSRGGLIAMILAAMQPTMVGPVVFNDIGPVIETDGIMRIAAYVGLIPLPRDWDEAVTIVKSANKRDFPDVTDDEWAHIARQLYNEERGRPSSGYDPKLQNALSVLDGPMPTLWPQFEALKRVPVLVMRGENSDILSKATVARMHRVHPMMRSFEIAGQGHAPLLRDAQSQHEIGRFLEDTDYGGLELFDTPMTQPGVSAGQQHRQAANDDRPSLTDTLFERTTAG